MVATVLIVATGAIGPVWADIYEWEDANGRHFTNSLATVPEEARETAKPVVRSEPAGIASDAPPPQVDEPKQSDVTTDDGDSDWSEGYSAGWEAGYRTAETAQPACPVEPSGVVLQSQPSVVVNTPLYDPTGVYFLPRNTGMLSVPFDDGETLGLTRRQTIQDLRSLERGW
jgi:hypothetical protein